MAVAAQARMEWALSEERSQNRPSVAGDEANDERGGCAHAASRLAVVLLTCRLRSCGPQPCEAMSRS